MLKKVILCLFFILPCLFEIDSTSLPSNSDSEIVNRGINHGDI